jgi:multicomponent Na+:H+ antiporter subunit B
MKRRLIELIVFLPVAFLLGFALIARFPADTPLADYVIEEGTRETGASNLVTSIYLGFRAFDTFGETIVLLLAVSGVVFLVHSESKERKDKGQ